MLKTLHKASIKTKVTLLTLIIFVISTWSLVFYASWALRQDMQQKLGEQQLASTRLLAENINEELVERIQALETIAADINPSTLNNVDALQALLEHRPILKAMFNGGVFTTSTNGVATASIPVSANRIGTNYMYRNHIKSALLEGKSKISDVVIGKVLNSPVVSIATPIRNQENKVVGAIVGVIDLSKPNFLSKIVDHRYGKTGGYYLVEKNQQLIITAYDKSLIMQKVKGHSVNHAAQINDDFNVYTNSAGVEALCATKDIPIANWYLSASMPTSEAFTSIQSIVKRMLIAATILTLLTGWLTWWTLRRQLSPLVKTVKTLSTLSKKNQRAEPLPITGQKETDQLITGFNQLLATLAQREDSLKDNETQLRTLVHTIPDLIWLKNEHGVYLSCNPMFEKFFGAKESEILGKTDYDFVDKDLADFFRENDRKAMLANKDSINEEWLTFADGSCHGLFETIKTPLRSQDGALIGVLGIARNITQHKLAEDELRIAATAFDSQEGILVTDANTIILRVNHAFTSITGYSPEEVIGKKPSILSSGRHKKEFYTSMWKSINSKGHWEGEVWNRRKNGEIYPEHLIITATKDDAGTVTNYVATLTDITLRKEAEKQIEDLAYIDPLTRIPNRRLFLDRLHQAIATSTRSNQRGALLFIDLDHFKTLNDTLGHDMGDLLLQQVAQRLATCVREGDTIARLGGDEFVVLLEGLGENEIEAAEKTESIGNKILNTLSSSYQLANHQHHSTPSIGATLFHQHDVDVDVLLKQADIAMYQAKDSGRDTLRFFDPLTQASIRARAELESELRKAIELDQFELYYQVQVNNSGYPIGAEVLVRWIHPERGMISPFNFIPLAEETGLILPLGQWVLNAACKQIKAWQQDPIAHDLILAVNVSAKQFLQPDFLDEVQKTIHQNEVDPKRLKLELTESSLLNHVDDVISKMHALKQIGIRFSLDDFGTGYSSLQYLRRLPLDQLKIDQSFVRDIAVDSSDRAIVRTIIAMAHSLDLNVIAEGVETEEQRDILKENHCTHYQGYLYSKPVPINEFESLLKTIMRA